MTRSNKNNGAITGRIVGYARVSTDGQSLDGQLATLKQHGASAIYREKVSGARSDRPQLRKALNAAMRQELIVRNVAALAELEQGKRRIMQTYTAEESARIREAARGNKYEAAIVLFNTTGCRLGEILGLRWEALDHEQGTMQIVTTLKEDGSGCCATA
jgi:integrase